MPKRLTEKELIKGLDAHTAHADELAQPLLSQEITPTERSPDCAQYNGHPSESGWDQFFEAEGVSEDFMEERGQPPCGDNK